MKFDSELYELTKSVSKEKKEYTKEELEFARVILNEFCKKAKEEKPQDGLIRVTFTRQWWSKVDKGYHEIIDLLKLGKFNTLFRHYNIYVGGLSYLGGLSFLEDELPPFIDEYFELIWDYRTYMDGLKNREMQEKIRRYEDNKRFNEYSKKWQEAAEIEEEIKTLQKRLDTLRR